MDPSLSLIGLSKLLQFDSEDWEDWLLDPPSPDELKKRFLRHKDWFEFSGNGPRFMQDFDTKMEGIQNQIKALFIDSPGVSTVKQNRDHFVKRDKIQSLCKSCTASALFTSSNQCPSGELE